VEKKVFSDQNVDEILREIVEVMEQRSAHNFLATSLAVLKEVF
jgi:uncharacterized protein YejL (UPF0352 family)